MTIDRATGADVGILSRPLDEVEACYGGSDAPAGREQIRAALCGTRPVVTVPLCEALDLAGLPGAGCGGRRPGRRGHGQPLRLRAGHLRVGGCSLRLPGP